MSNTPNPMLLAGLKRREDKAKRRGRAYGIGERHPDKLDLTPEDRARSRAWAELRRLAQTNGSPRHMTRVARGLN